METKDKINAVVSFLPFFEGKEQLIKSKVQTFLDLKYPLIPEIVDKEKNMKSLDNWLGI